MLVLCRDDGGSDDELDEVEPRLATAKKSQARLVLLSWF